MINPTFPQPDDSLSALTATSLSADQSTPLSSPMTIEEEASRHLKRGHQWERRARFSGWPSHVRQAIESYQQALVLNPYNATAYTALARVQWQQGEISLQTALNYCAMSLKLDPKHLEAYLLSAVLFQATRHTEEAVRSLQEAVNHIGLKALGTIWRLCARLHWQNVRQANHLSLLEKGVHVAAASGLFLAGTLGFFLNGNPLRVLADRAMISDIFMISILEMGKMTKALGLSGLAVRLFRWAADQMPEEPLFDHLLGDYYAQHGQYDSALFHYMRSQQRDPNNEVLHVKLKHLQAYGSTPEHHHLALPADSLSWEGSPEEVGVLSNESFDTAYSQAQQALEQGDFLRAIYQLKGLTHRFPDNPYLYSHMAYALFRLEDYDGAIEAYQQAIQCGHEPQWIGTVAQTLGIIYQQVKHQPQAAIECFQLAHQCNPNSPEVLSWLGEAYMDEGQLHSALEVYERLATLEPQNAQVYTHLGFVLWQLRKEEDAIEAYQQALTLNPFDSVAYNNLGVIYLDDRCQPRLALPLFQKACSLNPHYTLACFNVARALEGLGETVQAAKHYAEAQALNETNPELEADEIQQRLEQLFVAA